VNAAHRHHPLALDAKRVSASHGGTQVLFHVDLPARAGEWLAIVGPNGAGKSTLLRCLSGLMPTAGGEVMLQGQPLHQWPGRARAQHLAWLGQDVSGDPAMAVRDVVALGRLPHQGWLGLAGMRAADLGAVSQAMQDTDTTWAADRRMSALSGGERQRVLLARALAVQAPVMLLDEPVSHLDAPHQRLLARVLRREADKGRCVISVLHELPLALAADRLAVMQAGRIVAHGHRDDPQVHRAIEQVFDQAVTIVRADARWVVLPNFG
jgi:iron complex transport system ATP-binding protein